MTLLLQSVNFGPLFFFLERHPRLPSIEGFGVLVARGVVSVIVFQMFPLVILLHFSLL